MKKVKGGINVNSAIGKKRSDPIIKQKETQHLRNRQFP